MERRLLTPREEQVLDLIRRGYSNRGIADELGISLATARYHVSEIISKLGVSNREEAARWRPQRVLGIALLAPVVRMLSWEAVMKTTTAFVLAGGVLVLALISAGVLLMQSRSNAEVDPETRSADSDSLFRIRIPVLEIDSDLEVLYVGAEGDMPSPTWPDAIAVYDFFLATQNLGVRSSDSNTVVAAYRGTSLQPGPFYRLDSLQPGDVVEVEEGQETAVYGVIIICEVSVQSFGPVVFGTYLDSLTLITDHPGDPNKRLYVRAATPGALPSRCPSGNPYPPAN